MGKYWTKDVPKISFDDLDFRIVVRRAGGKLTKANMKRLNEMSDRIFRIGDYYRGEQGDIYAPSHSKEANLDKDKTK